MVEGKDHSLRQKRKLSPNERCSLTELKVICTIAGVDLPGILSYLR
jgi:hypothetical protein